MGAKILIRTVLVVDDDERLLAAAKRTLRDRSVHTTASPKIAKELATTEQLDLAIVDLRLKDASGIDLIRELRADHPDLHIALVSAYLSVTTAVPAVQAGADAVMFKPITYKEVVQRMESGDPARPCSYETPTLATIEWEHVHRVLAECSGNVSLAARQLGIYRSSLQRKLRKTAPQ